MGLLRQIRRGVAALFSPARANAEMDNEIRDFVQGRTRELVRENLSYEDAFRRATVEIGSVTATREEVRASGWEHGVDTLLSDGRYALRRQSGLSQIALRKEEVERAQQRSNAAG